LANPLWKDGFEQNKTKLNSPLETSRHTINFYISKLKEEEVFEIPPEYKSFLLDDCQRIAKLFQNKQSRNFMSNSE